MSNNSGKKACGCIYATSENTPTVKSGYEMGGYVKYFCEKHRPGRKIESMPNEFKKAVERVRAWAEAKGIYSGKLSALSQLLGAKAEALEYWEAIVKEKPLEEIKKEYGDIWVFLINYFSLHSETSIEQFYKIVEDNTPVLEISLEWDVDYVLTWDYQEDHAFSALVAGVMDLGHRMEMNATECINLAMDKNEKRKHTMKDGKLVKDEDLSQEEPCMAYQYRDQVALTVTEGQHSNKFDLYYYTNPVEVGVSPSLYKIQTIGAIKEIIFNDGSKVRLYRATKCVTFIDK